MPKISVVIPCYNLGRFLSETVESVLSQTFRDFEVIIVDDASTDVTTKHLIESLSSPEIRVLINPRNLGVAASRNAGIQLARGEFILPLDSDDIIVDTYMEKALQLFEQRPEIGIVYCDAEFFGEKCGQWELPTFSVQHLLTQNIIFSAAFFRKSDWQRSSGYRSDMSAGWEDWDFWLSLASMGVQVAKIPDTLFRYRIRKDSRDRSLSFSQKVHLFSSLLLKHRSLYCNHPISLFQLLLSLGKRYNCFSG